MRQINFSDVGVVVNSMEELDEIHLTYTTLGIPFEDIFDEHCEDAQRHDLVGFYIQSTMGNIETEVVDSDDPHVYISIIKYPIDYSMDKLDFAVAYHLLISNQTDELKAHLDKYCKEIK